MPFSTILQITLVPYMVNISQAWADKVKGKVLVEIFYFRLP